jgi:predicted phage tail protein
VVPLIGSPDHGQAINNTTAVLSWIIPTQSSSQLSYKLEYASKPDMSDAKVITNINKPFQQIIGLNLSTTYYWRVTSSNQNGSSNPSAIGSFKINNITDVLKEEVIPTAFELSQNYPNPFNPTTKIAFALPQNSFVSLKIYDMLGREIKSLLNSEMLAGNHSIDWNGEDNNGFKVASGAYIYKITAGNFMAVKKMVLIK